MTAQPPGDDLEVLEGWMWNTLVVLFYLPVALGCLLYLIWLGGEYLLWTRTLGEHPVRDVGLGLLAAVPILAASRWATPRLEVARRMAASLGRSFGELSWASCALIALSSAVGEELLFRGVLQAQLGWVPATILFAVAHVPIERDLWLWPVFALTTGLVLAALFHGTGAVLAPAVCHFVVNLLNLRWLSTGGASAPA